MFVVDAGVMYCLHADTRQSAVVRYLALVDRHGGGLAWTIVPSQRGVRTALAFGPEIERIEKPALYLYATKPQP